ncbi:MAG: hypothetical protein PF440_03085 [Thiomicrorhabdus sp.]|jgi:hypothetical protein|nr:hypothetical protein [Thiomicrorhabdus sp.]
MNIEEFSQLTNSELKTYPDGWVTFNSMCLVFYIESSPENYATYEQLKADGADLKMIVEVFTL